MKQQLRQTLIQARKSKDHEWIKETSQVICERIQGIFPLKDAKTIALYYPFHQEVDVIPLIEGLLQENKRVVLPKVLDKTTMAFFLIDDLHDVETSTFGVKEPVSNVVVQPEDIDWMFIPGIGFSKDCYRIGYGAGYYDRYLIDHSIYTVGVAFDFQIIDHFTPDVYDVPLKYIITENRLLQRQNEGGSSNRNRDS